MPDDDQAQTWGDVVNDILADPICTPEVLAKWVEVPRERIDAWLHGLRPTVEEVRAVHRISGDSIMRLLAAAYSWPLSEIARGATFDAVLFDDGLEEPERRRLINEYNELLRASRLARGQDEELGPLDAADGD